MRKFIIFLLFIIPVCALGHVLHVGSTTIPVHSEQYTTPSLHFKTGNGDIYHVPVTTQWLTGTLHFFDGTTTYSACSGTKTHVGHYWFIGSCLVGADNNVYLENAGLAWISTDYVETTTMTVDAKFYVESYGNSSSNYLYGGRYNNGFVNNALYGKWQQENSVFEYDGKGLYSFSPVNFIIMKQQISGNTFYVNINGIETATDVVSEYSYEPGIVDIWACNMGKDNYRVYPEPMRTYYFIIRDNEIMVRHFVPVPAGLQIGNYTVPENGMWDVVEQKFYGNDGAGDFIYGVDQ